MTQCKAFLEGGSRHPRSTTFPCLLLLLLCSQGVRTWIEDLQISDLLGHTEEDGAFVASILLGNNRLRLSSVSCLLNLQESRCEREREKERNSKA